MDEEIYGETQSSYNIFKRQSKNVNSMIRISQTLTKVGNLSHHWICLPMTTVTPKCLQPTFLWLLLLNPCTSCTYKDRLIKLTFSDFAKLKYWVLQIKKSAICTLILHFICGYKDLPWKYECVNGWNMGGTWLFGCLLTFFPIYNSSVLSHWTSSFKLFSRTKRPILDGDSIYGKVQGHLPGYKENETPYLSGEEKPWT